MVVLVRLRLVSSSGYLVADVNVIWVFHRLWAPLESNGLVLSRRRHDQEELQIISKDCKIEKKPGLDGSVMEEVYKTQKAIQ
ncbi:hypothetical protein CsSME_00043108 [Camellia sinensis var. sinensis]